MIKKISAEMQNGYWMKSGDAIQFDRDGQLVDGQHRLLACVHSNIAQEFIVVYGLNPEVIKVLDTGKQRSSADVLSMRGYGKDSTILANLSKAILSFKEIGTYQLNGHRALKGGKFVTNSKIVEFLEGNETVKQFVTRYKKPYGNFKS